MSPWNNQRGFTLIEVIIATVILFSAIMSGAMVYRTSMKSMERVTATTVMASALPFIIDMVREELVSTGTDQSSGQYDRLISYSFTAQKNKLSPNIEHAHDELTAGLEYGDFDLLLTDVRLTINYQENDGGKQYEIYNYQELLWKKQN